MALLSAACSDAMTAPPRGSAGFDEEAVAGVLDVGDDLR
jgi:hypothetical protein